MMKKKIKCCICGCEIEDYGNNPAGAMWRNENGEIEEPVFGKKDRCCNNCDNMYVIPGRMYKLRMYINKE